MKETPRALWPFATKIEGIWNYLQLYSNMYQGEWESLHIAACCFLGVIIHKHAVGSYSTQYKRLMNSGANARN